MYILKNAPHRSLILSVKPPNNTCLHLYGILIIAIIFHECLTLSQKYFLICYACFYQISSVKALVKVLLPYEFRMLLIVIEIYFIVSHYETTHPAIESLNLLFIR